jgi:hypothetical protein
VPFGFAHVVSGLAPKNDQLMSENYILGRKSAARLEWRGNDGQKKAEQSEHCRLTLGESASE